MGGQVRWSQCCGREAGPTTQLLSSRVACESWQEAQLGSLPRKQQGPRSYPLLSTLVQGVASANQLNVILDQSHQSPNIGPDCAGSSGRCLNNNKKKPSSRRTCITAEPTGTHLVHRKPLLLQNSGVLTHKEGAHVLYDVLVCRTYLKIYQGITLQRTQKFQCSGRARPVLI